MTRRLAFGIIVVLVGLTWAIPRPAAADAPEMAATTPTAPAWKRIHYGNPRALKLRSQVGLVVDERDGVILYARDIDKSRPIASLTKLLTVLTLLDAGISLETEIEITRQDRDRLKGSRSSLPYGSTLTRGDLMRIALVASDNRATAALGRTYPGGAGALVAAMNEKAAELGLTHTRASDASGLRPGNVSTGRDLAKLAWIARGYQRINSWSTTRRFTVTDRKSGRTLAFRNTNSLVHRQRWKLELSKTGYTSEAGNCLLMRTTIADRPLIVVLLNSWGKLSKYGDSGRIRDWLVASERAGRSDANQATRERSTDGVLLQLDSAQHYTLFRPDHTIVARDPSD